MRVVILLCVVLIVNCDTDNTADSKEPIVKIDQGLVRGKKASNGTYSSFLGIPYAIVDSGNPFGACLKHPGFGDSVFDAYDGSIACPQPKENGTLDCLRLNIYVPKKASSENPLPVLVWIYGGRFTFGKAGTYSEHNLVNQDIVLVTINYRVGVYGFMCLDHPAVPGNQGLKDQLAALRWVKHNIAAFGGNPNDVTLAGQSAGSISVEYHLFSPNEKLFNKAILQSGVGATDGARFVEADKQAAVKIAMHSGSYTPVHNIDDALRILKRLPLDVVLATVDKLKLDFCPCKEKEFNGVEIFIRDGPYSMSNSNKINGTTIMMGTTSKEHYGSSERSGVDVNSRPFYDELQGTFDLAEKELKRAAMYVRHFYLGDEAISDAVYSILDDFEGDFEVNYQVERSIARFIHEKAGPIYEYVYNYVSENDRGEKNSAPHTAELKYLFAANYQNFNVEETLISDRITSLWGNFIKYGIPTPETNELLPVNWKPVGRDVRPYLTIDTELSLRHRFRSQSMAFWNLFYKHYGQYNKLV